MRSHAEVVAELRRQALDAYIDDRITVAEYNRLARTADKRAARNISPTRREQIIDAADGQCEYCVNMLAVVVDHANPVTSGGTRDDDNLKAACRLCNYDKATFTIDQWCAARMADGESWPPNWWADIRDELAAKTPDEPRLAVLDRLADPNVTLSEIVAAGPDDLAVRVLVGVARDRNRIPR